MNSIFPSSLTFPQFLIFATAPILIISFVTLLITTKILYFSQIEYISTQKTGIKGDLSISMTSKIFLFQFHGHLRHDGVGAGEEGGAHGGDVERPLQPQHLQLLLCRRGCPAHHQVFKRHATILVFQLYFSSSMRASDIRQFALKI